MNTLVKYLFKIQISFPLYINLVMTFQDYMLVLILMFWGISTFPKWLHNVHFTNSSHAFIVTASESWVQQILWGILQWGLWKQLKIRKMDRLILSQVGDLKQTLSFLVTVSIHQEDIPMVNIYASNIGTYLNILRKCYQVWRQK